MTALARKIVIDTAATEFAADVVAGLTAQPKRLSPKYFYDSTGSALFEQITELPEYYTTRTEIGILSEHTNDIAALIPAGAALINGVLVRNLDLNDIYVGKEPSHPSENIPAALAVCEEASRSGWIAWSIGCGVMSAMGIFFYIMAPEMFELLCPQKNQHEVIAAGVPVLRLVAFAMPPLACIIIFTGALRGAGDTRLPMVVSWFGFLVIRIPLAYFLMYRTIDLGPLGTIQGLELGLYGAWLAMSADLLVRGGFLMARFASGRWQKIRV